MMKDRSKRAWGMTLAVVLFLAFLPFSAFAQTEPTYLRNMKQVAPVGSEEIMLTLEGTVHGGQFIFSGDTIRFTNGRRYRWAEKIFVNGEKWADITKPFELGFTPDFAKAVILEKEGGPEGRVYVVPRDNRFALVFAPSDDLLPSEFFRVKLR